MLNGLKFALGIGGAGAASLLAARRIAAAPPHAITAMRAQIAEYWGPWKHHYVHVNDLRLHYVEMGTGPLVLLLHGFPQCWYQWRHVMPTLSERFRVVAPDMRGYNRSDKPPVVQEYTLDKLAADVVGLMRALGEERAHIVGHDWGGAVAWHIGAHYPERVDKLAVVNAPHPAAYLREAKRLEQLVRSYYIFLFQLPLLPEAMLRLTVRRGLRSTAYVKQAFPGQALDVYENAVSQPHAATATINYYRAAVRFAGDYRRQATRTIPGPTMLVWGMQDFALSPRLTEGLDEWVPGIRVERIEECGHWVPEERPRLLTDLLSGFLSTQP